MDILKYRNDLSGLSDEVFNETIEILVGKPVVFEGKEIGKIVSVDVEPGTKIVEAIAHVIAPESLKLKTDIKVSFK